MLTFSARAIFRRRNLISLRALSPADPFCVFFPFLLRAEWAGTARRRRRGRFSSPMIWRTTSLLLLLQMSSPVNTIYCQVPKVSLRSLKDTVRLGPMRMPNMGECAALSSIAGKSKVSPGSYSMAVSAPVDPATNKVTMPLLTSVESRIRHTSS